MRFNLILFVFILEIRILMESLSWVAFLTYLGSGFFQKSVGHLDEYAGAGGFVTAAGAAMGEIDQNLQPVGNDPVGFFTLHVADHADPAGIMLEAGIIKSPRLGSVAYRYGQVMVSH